MVESGIDGSDSIEIQSDKPQSDKPRFSDKAQSDKPQSSHDTNATDVPNVEMPSKHTNNTSNTLPFEIKRNAIIIGDDAFSILLDAEHSKDASTKSSEMLKLVRHLSGFSEYTSHHGQLHLLINVQEPKLSTGNSLIAQHCRRLKNNFDVIILFNLQSTSARSFISSLCTGQEYQELKAIYQYATKMPYTPRVSDSLDQRVGYPYLAFSIKHNISDPELKYR